MSYLRAELEKSPDQVDALILCWMGNEMFSHQRKYKSHMPAGLLDVASRLARRMTEVAVHPVAVIGGDSTLWNAGEEFDVAISQVAAQFRKEGVFVHDGSCLFRGCSRSEDGWHIQDTESNRLRMAQYLAKVLDAAIATQWDPRWLRTNSVMVDALAQCQTLMTRGEGGEFAPPQEREDVKMVSSSAAFASLGVPLLPSTFGCPVSVASDVLM